MFSSACADHEHDRGAILTGKLEKYVVEHADGTHRVAYALERDDFAGRSVTRTQSLACFNEVQLNDALSSIETRGNGMAPSTDAGTDASVRPSDAGLDAAQPDGGWTASDASQAPMRDAGKADLDRNDAATPDDDDSTGGGRSRNPACTGEPTTHWAFPGRSPHPWRFARYRGE